MYFAVGDDSDRHLCIIDNKGNKIENAVINGNFDCSGMKLTSLESGPREVKGNFFCLHNFIVSLKGAPIEVGGDFMCSECYSLTSLEGAPEKVSGYFKCIDCRSLTSLVGAPQKIGRGFECDRCFSLSSLEGAPYLKGGCFYGFPTCNLSKKQVHEYFKWMIDYPSNHIGFETYHDKYTT